MEGSTAKGQTNRRVETMVEVQVFGWMAPGCAVINNPTVHYLRSVLGTHIATTTKRNGTRGKAPFMQIICRFHPVIHFFFATDTKMIYFFNTVKEKSLERLFHVSGGGLLSCFGLELTDKDNM